MIATESRDYQVLLDRPRGAGMIVSCYLNTSVIEGFERRWRQPLEVEARRVRQDLAGDPEALDEFERQLGLIRHALESAGGPSARGMAIFTASGWDQALAQGFDSPFEDRLVVDEEPYLVPLLMDHLLHPQYLLVLTDTHRGRIYAGRPGSSRLLDEIDEAVPRKNRSAGERWGKQQATTARHREDRILHYFKDLAERVEAAWTEGVDRGIILLGEREVLEDFRGFLPRRLADRVVDEAPHAWAGEQPAIEEHVRRVVAKTVAVEWRRLLDEIDGRLHEGCAVATGPREVIEALSNGQVRSLVLGPDRGEAAWRCSGCRSLFTTEERACPYCEAPCDRANLWQEILTRAVRHHVDIHFIGPEARRNVPGEVAALLVRDEPPRAPSGGGTPPPVERGS